MEEHALSITEPDELAESLGQNCAWPGAAGPAQWIQTHISHVFLVGDRVYKLRKNARLGFLDFGTRALRNDDCLREVRLNRRLARSVYLGVAPVILTPSGVEIGAIGEGLADPALEHVVVMRRLPAERDAHSLLDRGELDATRLETVAAQIARFHEGQSLGVPAPWSARGWPERIADPIMASVEVLGETKAISDDRLMTLCGAIEGELTRLAPAFEERRLAGCAVDGHGDLHLEHIWFEDDSPPQIIDCIEFNDDLRKIDRAAEVAFLSMDLAYRNQLNLAECFLGAYATESDDYGAFAVVDFFAAYRALVRAKVASLAANQSSIESDQRAAARGSIERHVQLAETLLEPAESGGLILTCGTVGSGKSSVARHLARTGAGTPIVSDRVRKRLAGLDATARAAAGPDEGLYRPERTEHVYRALLKRAGPVVASGRQAILDASFSSRVQRDLARDWARQRGVPIRLIEVRCTPDVARQRLGERARSGRDPSDAGPEFLDTSVERFESPDEWSSNQRDVVHTDRDDWRDKLLRR